MEECGNLWDLLTESPRASPHKGSSAALSVCFGDASKGRQGICEQREGIFQSVECDDFLK